MKTRCTELFGVKHPIGQGGMQSDRHKPAEAGRSQIVRRPPVTLRPSAIALFAAALCSGPLASAQTVAPGVAADAGARSYVAPRTSSGQPSLEGNWNHNSFLILEAPEGVPNLILSEVEAKTIGDKIMNAFADRLEKALDPELPEIARSTDGLGVVRGQRRSRSVVEPADGKLPYTAAARKEIADRKPAPMDNPEERPNWERCLSNLGLTPMTAIGNGKLNPWMIVQTSGHVVVHTEYGGETRLIPLTDAHMPAEVRPQWGDSIGRWEGETLVVETIGLPAKERIRSVSNLIVSTDAKVIERFTRISDDELLYQYTVVDPEVYEKPWLAEYSLYRTSERIYEHACHEGNYSIANILSGARVLEKKEPAKTPR